VWGFLRYRWSDLENRTGERGVHAPAESVGLWKRSRDQSPRAPHALALVPTRPRPLSPRAPLSPLAFFICPPVAAIKVYLYTPVRAVLLLLDLVGVRLSKHAHGTWIGVPQHQFIEGDTCDTSMAAHWTAWGSEYSVLPDVRNGRAVRVRAASSILLAQPGPCLVF